MSTRKPSNVDEYIQMAPAMVQVKLQELRSILRSVAPLTNETLKWGQPVFVKRTILFVYSAHKSHLTFTPTRRSLMPFESRLTQYVVKKDSIQFRYSEPLPSELIRQIATYRLKDLEEHGAKWKY
jgi:uncharacterized protein YdhG (YjbR/CyaY superfamily)